MNSSQLFERAKKVAPGGVHSPIRSLQSLGRDPVFFNKAEGPYLWSVEGQRYIDYCQSWGPLILGHRDSDVEAKVHEMVSTAWSFGACEPYSLELAEWMVAHIPFIQKVRFVSSGTEAVMSALRVARAATKRNKILKFEGCYHGCVDALLVQAGSGLAGTATLSSEGIPAEVRGSTLVAPLDDEETFENIMRREGDQIAAVIIEPLPANYGLLVQRTEFLKKVAQVTKKYGALLIFDEVISGFRMALGGMAELTGITPDLVTYGKVIGGGFPVGCYAGRQDLMDFVAPNGPVYQAGTLSANPIGMRAGLCTLQKMLEGKCWQKLEEKGVYLEKNLKPAMEQHGIEFVRQGSLFWTHLKTEEPVRQIQQIPAGQKEFFKRFFERALAQKIYLAPHAYEVGFLSLAHTQSVLDETIDVLTSILEGRS